MSTGAHTHDEPEHEPATKPRRRRVAAVSVAAAVVLAAGGTYFAQSVAGSGDAPSDVPAAVDRDDPAPLPLDGYGGAAKKGEGDEKSPPSYALTGDSGKAPDEAPVYRTTKVKASTVTKLASALGVRAKPVKQGETWVVSEGRDGTGPALRVSGTAKGQQGQWSFSRHSPASSAKCGKLPQPDKPPRCPSLEGDVGAGPDAPVSSDGAPAKDGVIGERAGGQDPVSEREAKRSVGPVLRVLGLQQAELDASTTTGALRTVKAQPELDGLSVQGWDTRLTVGADGDLVRGHGALAPLAKSATYPVLSAQETLKQLNKHRPFRTEIHCVKEPCEGGGKSGPTKVSRASFVLAAHTSQGKRVLVPSWSFEFGADRSVNYPALAPRHLAKDTGKPSDGSGSSGDSRPGGGGSVDPSEPAKPAPPGNSVESYGSGDRTLTVHFWGGVCSDYTVQAKETAERVRIMVTEKEHKPGAPCIKIAKAMSDKVTLDKPVGERTVVDEDGKKLRER